MESGINKSGSKISLFLFELVGTTIFLCGYQFTIPGYDFIGSAFSLSALLFIATLLVGRVSGAHFNMAVSLSVFITEWKNKSSNFITFLVMIMG